MSVRQCDRVISAVTRQPWAITPDGLELVLGIAQRQLSDHEAVLAAPTQRRESGKVQMRDGVAIIPVMGPIFPHANLFTEVSGATSIETLALRFGEAIDARDVKAIVLHIDSPGGQATGVHEFAGQIFAARDSKPITAYVSGVAGSAAYWIASAASKIVADETALLGSIGVVAAWSDNKKARETAGFTDYEVVSSQSPNKHLDPQSHEGRAAMQRLLDEKADIFIADVARNRGKRVATVTEQFGQGGVMHAAQAVKVGMADEIGSLEAVIAALSSGGGPKTGRAGTSARINKEMTMTREELAQNHPELLAQIQAETRAETENTLSAQHQTDLEAANTNWTACVSAVAGETVATAAAELVKTGVNAAQLAALAPMLAQPAATAAAPAAPANPDSDSRAAILASLRGATPAPVATAPQPRQGDSVQATIDRIAAIGV